MMAQKQHIAVAVDAIVFGYDKKGLSLLLIERKNPDGKKKWALPGGFVEKKENLQQAVQRELKEETNLSLNYLQQFYTFGAIDRDPRGRVISVAHLVLVKKNKHQIQGGDDAKLAKWFPLSMLPKMAFDHTDIVEKATDVLRQKIASLTTDCIENVPSPADIKLISAQLSGDHRNNKK